MNSIGRHSGMRRISGRTAGGFRRYGITTRWGELRLHHWDHPTVSNVHSEARSFVSLILRGYLVETRYTPALRATGVHVRRPGRAYRLAAGQLHQINAPAGTWTVSVRGPVRCDPVAIIKGGIR